MLLLLTMALAAEVDGPWTAGAYVDLAVSADGGVHAVWVEGDVLRYARVGGAPETVAAGVTTGDAGQIRPQLALDGGGQPAVAYAAAGKIHLARRADAWTSAALGGGAGLLALTVAAGQPVVAWLAPDGVRVGAERAYDGGADGVCPCCAPAVHARAEGVAVAFRDADGPRRDVRLVTREAGAWVDRGDATTGRWSPGGCPADGPALTETTILVSDARTGKRRIHEVSARGEQLLSTRTADREAVQPRALPDGSLYAWVEVAPGLSELVARDGPGPPVLVATSAGRLEPGDPVAVGSEVWIPWQGDAAHVAKVP